MDLNERREALVAAIAKNYSEQRINSMCIAFGMILAMDPTKSDEEFLSKIQLAVDTADLYDAGYRVRTEVKQQD